MKVYVQNSICKVEDAGAGLKVSIKDINGKVTVIDCDSLVMSVGYVAGAPLADKLVAAGVSADKVHVIGDANRVGNLLTVIKESYNTAYAI
jgi:hypothetical protein